MDRVMRRWLCETIRKLTLDDLDIPNGRITLAGRQERLGDLTRTALLAYLADRHRRWPHTANRHVLVSQQSANGTAPVSTYFLKKHLTLRGVSLHCVRSDRVLHEALTSGADPLRLAVVFGLHPTTATKYAELARRILAEQSPLTGQEPNTATC